ncbi:MAG: bifunctional UDP-N-acetylglucosamine diphosphorylase/glucosamine-1-phosphate N-acetyltransferase GlmU [Oscillospiraceae bacterium]
MSKTCAVILAAGEGKRMKSDYSKVLSKVLFKPMIDWVAQAVIESGTQDICVITGHTSELVRKHMGDGFCFAEQTERLGTGHAVMQAADFIKNSGAENVLVVNGDAPLMDEMTIEDSLEQHIATGSAVTIVSACIKRPIGYGRIVRDIHGNVLKIVEQRDATDDEKEIHEVNSGAYWFKSKELLFALSHLKADNDQSEYYLTDTIEILMGIGEKISAFITENTSVILGANDKMQLMELNEIARHEILRMLMFDGVDIPCTDGVIIGDEVSVGRGTTILPNTIIRGNSSIGCDCELGPNCLIDDSEIKDNVKIANVQIENSVVENCADIGPYAHIRPNSHIGESVHIGNFVEVKNSNIGKGTKLPHLTYIGDSDIGEKVNFGCGSLTVNYNGKDKARTVVNDHAFIGCNTNLIAPVTVGEYAYTAAGSTITSDVPAFALSIARSIQTNKEDWVKSRKPFKNME